jgi:hypothetical protein
MFGGSMSLDCFGRFLDQITTGKRYNCLAIGCNVWGVGSMSSDCFGGFVAMFLASFSIKLPITTRKKRYSRLAIDWNVY